MSTSGLLPLHKIIATLERVILSVIIASEKKNDFTVGMADVVGNNPG